MSKNSTLKDTVNAVTNITKDENFKDVIRYKGIAALLVKLTIPEFYDKSLVQIARAIVNTRERQEEMSDVAILEDEVDFFPTEAGTKDEKNTVNDAIFRVNLDSDVANIKLKCVDKEITVNTEMQTSKPSAYSIISRAIYYGASLLRDTVPAGDTDYTNIHKVYTIWFCTVNLKLKEYDEVKDKYIHRYGFRRFYDGVPKTAIPEKEADLIEAVIVELPKMKKYADSDTESLVYQLFYETDNVIDSIEAHEKVNLTKIRKGVDDMLDYEARTQKRVDEAKLDLAKNFVDNMKSQTPNETYANIIKMATLMLGLDETIIQKLNNMYTL